MASQNIKTARMHCRRSSGDVIGPSERRPTPLQLPPCRLRETSTPMTGWNAVTGRCQLVNNPRGCVDATSEDGGPLSYGLHHAWTSRRSPGNPDFRFRCTLICALCRPQSRKRHGHLSPVSGVGTRLMTYMCGLPWACGFISCSALVPFPSTSDRLSLQSQLQHKPHQ